MVERLPYTQNVGGSIPSQPTRKGYHMPMYETTVRTPQGDTKDKVFAPNVQEAKKLFEQRHGPRNVPYIPHMIPS